MSFRCGHMLGGAPCRCCAQMFSGGTWLLYPETPITTQVTAEEGMVSILLGPGEQIRLDFLDPDPMDRFVATANQAHRSFQGIEHHLPRQS